MSNFFKHASANAPSPYHNTVQATKFPRSMNISICRTILPALSESFSDIQVRERPLLHNCQRNKKRFEMARCKIINRKNAITVDVLYSCSYNRIVCTRISDYLLSRCSIAAAINKGAECLFPRSIFLIIDAQSFYSTDKQNAYYGRLLPPRYMAKQAETSLIPRPFSSDRLKV